MRPFFRGVGGVGVEKELDSLGIRPGEEFVLVHPDAIVAPLSNPSATKLGPFQRHSSTSRRAAIDAYPRQGTQRWRIIHALATANATREELAEYLKLPDNSVRPRVAELVKGGWVYETRQTRPTRTGSEAAVLALTDQAILGRPGL